MKVKRSVCSICAVIALLIATGLATPGPVRAAWSFNSHDVGTSVMCRMVETPVKVDGEIDEWDADDCAPGNLCAR